MISEAETIVASPGKLKDGSWGAWVPGPVAEGQVITIVTRSGKAWQARVAEIARRSKGAALVATVRIHEREQNQQEIQAAKAAVASREKEREQAVEASRATDADIELPTPDGCEPMPFQRAGVAYATRALAKQPGVLFGDEMGLGKTIQALLTCNVIDAGSVLVVCPASLRINWQREAEKWLARHHEAFVVMSGKDEIPESATLVVVNDDLVWRKAILGQLSARSWHAMIVDEAHRLKNPKAKRTRGVFGWYDRSAKEERPGLAASARHLMLLTGTPVMNKPVELWPLVHAIDPATWSSFFAFARRYCGARQVDAGRRLVWDFSGSSNLGELQERLRAGGMVRRLKSEVLAELPAKRRQVLAIPANGLRPLVDRELSIWSEHESRFEDLTAEVDLADAAGDAERYRAAAAKLKSETQAVFSEMAAIRHEVGVAKAGKVVEHLLEVLESERKVVVFAHHREVIRQITEGLAESGHRAVQVTGSTPMAERQAAVDAFQSDDAVRVFVGNIQAAGVGLTLTASSLVVFAELDWVPANLTQAEDRCHRIGQKDSVLVQHIVLDGSLDARMARELVAKQALADAALDAPPAGAPAPEAQEGSAGAAGAPRANKSPCPRAYPRASEEERQAAAAALRYLASYDQDRARKVNGVGFNKLDGRIGHELAERDRLTDGQVWLAKRVLSKYRRTQLPPDMAAALWGEEATQ